MHITHVALWTTHLETMKDFYVRFFNGVANQKYVNPRRGFESYFITFDSGARLELMQIPDLQPTNAGILRTGWAHVAIAVESREHVKELTQLIREGGYTVLSEPRTTGDGYYESVIADPDGNQIEITI